MLPSMVLVLALCEIHWWMAVSNYVVCVCTGGEVWFVREIRFWYRVGVYWVNLIWSILYIFYESLGKLLRRPLVYIYFKDRLYCWNGAIAWIALWIAFLPPEVNKLLYSVYSASCTLVGGFLYLAVAENDTLWTVFSVATDLILSGSNFSVAEG